MALFKQCTSCRYKWPDREDFLADPDISVVGYQVNYGELEAGLFLFVHGIPGCGTSLAIMAGEFTDMHDGPIFETSLANTDKCGGHCLRETDLEPCPKQCECAYVRDVLQKVRYWPKKR